MSWRIPSVVQHALPIEPVILSPHTFVTLLLPAFLSYYGMAVLVQLPGTRLYRVALLPVVFWLAARPYLGLDASFGAPELAYLNQGVALGMFTVALRSTAWVLTQKTYARYPIHTPSSKPMNGKTGNTSTTDPVSLRTATWNAWDLTMNMRGIGWNWSHSTYIPKPSFQTTSRRVFFLLSLFRFLFLAIIFDVLTRSVQSLTSATIGTIFDPTLPPLTRYLRSSLVVFLSGISGYVVITLTYYLHATLFILLFQQYPSQWPPLFDAPWFSTSLTDLWGRRWHQLFREYFVGVGGKPLGRYLGTPGVVLGAFLISGCLHDIGMRGMRRGGDTIPILLFFLMQGVGVLLEGVWKGMTGKKVGGVRGWAWMWVWLLVWGNVLVDVWERRALLRSMFFVEGYRPAGMALGWLGFDA